MKGLPRLDVGTFLLLFGILHMGIRVIMNFVKRRKMLLLKCLKVSMGLGDLETRPLLPSVSLLYM
jgi:hypothetical protein